MKKLITLSLPVLLLGMILFGCQGESPVTPITSPYNMGSMLSIPSGAVLESAVLYIYGTPNVTGGTINIHRVNAPWDEATVTWDNFGGAYETDIITSFTPVALSWNTVDLTDLVAAWMDGTYENYGILLEQDVSGSARFISSESINAPLRPTLEICYTLNGETDCFIIQRDVYGMVMDAFINQQYPLMNFGGTADLLTGVIHDHLKQSLIRFDMEDIPDDGGCSLTIGFWKNHSGFGPQADVVSQYLPIWLGTDGGAKSIAVTDNQIAYDILTQHVYGVPKNGITKLYAQLLGAKLNLASGADGTVISDAITEADAFLAMYDWTDWDSFSKDEQKDIIHLKSMFDDYNNGLIGPGHCDDIGEIAPDDCDFLGETE